MNANRTACGDTPAAQSSDAAAAAAAAAQPAPAPATAASAQAQPQKDDGSQHASLEPSPRLYVGNFNERVNEFTVVKLFEPFGRIASIDYLWNHEGPRQGMPRGYCFVEMETVQQATKAIAALNHKVVAGRPLSVAYSAPRAPPADDDGLTPWQRRQAREALAAAKDAVNPRLQAKTGVQLSKENKIKALERKLAQLRDRDASPAAAAGDASVVAPPETPFSGDFISLGADADARTNRKRGASSNHQRRGAGRPGARFKPYRRK
ncbi:hypothetical protein HK105_203872 [Polyrhizophydium stewartii]|uniref:RRM domain-containing protein n=1 Tax=Polyrhizophydium stewartii TaxID=2732419 RepID=A0ABR4NAB3_9FUNG|nr:hypothetical protein HK105_003001 [Polyrhizophydium stewartii]